MQSSATIRTPNIHPKSVRNRWLYLTPYEELTRPQKSLLELMLNSTVLYGALLQYIMDACR